MLLDNIRAWTASYGKVKLVLKHNHYYLESSQPEMLQRLLRDPVIKGARVDASAENEQQQPAPGQAGEDAIVGRDQAPRRAGLVIPGTQAAKKARLDALVGSTASSGWAREASSTPLPVGDAERNDPDGVRAAVREEDDFFKGVTVGLDKGASFLCRLHLPGGQARTSTDLAVGQPTDDQLDEDEDVHTFEIKPTDIEVRPAIFTRFLMVQPAKRFASRSLSDCEEALQGYRIPRPGGVRLPKRPSQR